MLIAVGSPLEALGINGTHGCPLSSYTAFDPTPFAVRRGRGGVGPPCDHTLRLMIAQGYEALEER